MDTWRPLPFLTTVTWIRNCSRIPTRSVIDRTCEELVERMCNSRVRSRNRKRTSWKSSSATRRSNSHNHLALYYTSSSPAILCSPRNCCLNFLHASSEQIKTQFENQRWTEYQYITVLLAWMTEQNKKKQSTPNRRSWPRHTFLC